MRVIVDIRARLAIGLVVAFVTGKHSFADEHRPRNYIQRFEDLKLHIHENAEFEMIAIPGGEFTMRALEVDPKDADKITRHDKEYRVKLSPYWIGKTEMPWEVASLWAAPPQKVKERFNNFFEERTRTAYLACPGFRGVYARQLEDGGPVASLSHFGAKRYCHWLSLITGKFYRLPTEAEWEFAYRAGSQGKYPWGDSEAAPEQMEIDDYLHVGLHEANAWGIYDMAGNVQEWVCDGFHEGYSAFGDQPLLVDPVAWPVGGLAAQAEPFPLPRDPSELPEFSPRNDGVVGSWTRASERLDEATVRRLRDQFKAKGQVVALGPGVARGGCDHGYVAPSSEHFACAMRYRPSINPNTKTIDIVLDNSMYWNEGHIPNAVGFRVARPEKVPPREVQLWHWGIYAHHEFWLKYTIEPNE